MANVKAEKFQKFIDENKVLGFAVQEEKDKLNTVLFRGTLSVAKQVLPIVVAVDDSVYTLIQVQLSSTASEGALEKILPYLNKLNLAYKCFKYSVIENGPVLLTVSIPSSGDYFDSTLVFSLIMQTITPHLEAEYPLLMKAIWGKA